MLIDRLTQRWVIATGRPVDLSAARWLDGPVGATHGIGEVWIDQHARRSGAHPVAGDTGLVPDLAALDGAGFHAADLHASVRDFYEGTSGWELDVWSRWRTWAEPGGRLMNAVFARRLRQLTLPVDPLDTALGMDSRVIALRSLDGDHLGTVWQRTLRATGATVFGGFYGIVTPPDAARPVVRVVFPLPNGNLTVLLRPDVGSDGSLWLRSPSGPFGAPGAYLVVRAGEGPRAWARRIPLPETFHVFVDDRGELRCDHHLSLGSAEILHLHYRMRRS